MTTQANTKSPLSTPTLAVGIVAAVLGALSLLPLVGLLAAFFAFIAALAAIIMGHMAVAKSADRRARLGLTLGYVGLGLTVGWIVVRFAAASF